MPVYKIPRQSDRDIVSALGRVRIALKPIVNVEIRLTVPRGSEIGLPELEPEKHQPIEFVLGQGSEILDHIHLRGPQNATVAAVRRTFDKVFDEVTVPEDWSNFLPDNIRSQAWVAVAASVRKELKATELDAAFRGQDDNAWNRYRDAQATVVNSLQKATETILTKTTERSIQLDRERDERFAALEKTLRDDFAGEKAKLEKSISDQRETLNQREKALADRESAFNTKEARYVARKKQEEQIEQVKNWLNDWKLTRGTTEKRRGVFWGYTSALVITGCLTAFATYSNYQLLKSADDIAKLEWWHWLALISKSFFPLAAFTTFMVYFIRWSSAWARQHADEEFINRTRLIDIGRSSWLLEAVRDAQERSKEIPPELLKELSRNLFTHTASNDTDIQPSPARRADADCGGSGAAAKRGRGVGDGGVGQPAAGCAASTVYFAKSLHGRIGMILPSLNHPSAFHLGVRRLAQFIFQNRVYRAVNDL